MKEKVDFNKCNFCFMRFCVGGYLLKLCRGHLSRAGMSRSSTHSASAMHSTKCRIAEYVFCWKKMLKFESNKKKKGFNEFISLYFEKIMAYHLFALCICMYIGIRKTSLLIKLEKSVSICSVKFEIFPIR